MSEIEGTILEKVKGTCEIRGENSDEIIAVCGPNLDGRIVDNQKINFNKADMMKPATPENLKVLFNKYNMV